jgi:tRNA (guanine37-N1)-methyltransferase
MTSPWRASILTIFPDMFPGPLAHSLIGKALEAGIWSLAAVDIRDFATDRHRSVDDVPFGGGAGMVMRADVIDRAVEAVHGGDDQLALLYMSPKGRRFDQAMARELAAGPGCVILCGRYEGVDERVLEKRRFAEVSLGDFVMTGGEIAAMALLDATVRLLPGVVGKEASLEDESFAHGLLEYPHYTRPQTWQGRSVPEVLLSGHHGRIRDWRKAAALALTRRRRPDLLGPDLPGPDLPDDNGRYETP